MHPNDIATLHNRVVKLEKIVEELFETIKWNNKMLKDRINELGYVKSRIIEIKSNQKGE
jgi:Ni,Fe-hydrogenase III large subunit